jgi:hypothetical protein
MAVATAAFIRLSSSRLEKTGIAEPARIATMPSIARSSGSEWPRGAVIRTNMGRG